MNDILSLSATALADKIKTRALSSAEVTAAFLARADACEPDIRAFVTRLADDARAQAAVVDDTIGADWLRACA